MSSSSIQAPPVVESQIQQPQHQQQQVVPLTLDAATADSIFKANKRISDYVHQIANEPSVGMYHVQEHIRKTIPKNVAIKKDIRDLTTNIEEVLYNVGDSTNSIQTLSEIDTFNHIHDMLLSSIDKVSKLVNNKSLQFVNSSHLKSTATSTFQSYRSFEQVSSGSNQSSSSSFTTTISPNSSVQYDNLNNSNNTNNDSESMDNFNEIPINSQPITTTTTTTSSSSSLSSSYNNEPYDYLSTSKKKSTKSSSSSSKKNTSKKKEKETMTLQPKQF